MDSIRSSDDVELAKRSSSILIEVSTPPFAPRNPMTNPQVSFGTGQAGICMRTLHSSSTLLGDILAMTTVLFCEGEQSLNGLLICWLSAYAKQSSMSRTYSPNGPGSQQSSF